MHHKILHKEFDIYLYFGPMQDLERGLETSGTTHAQEVKGLRARNRALASEAVSLRDNIENLHSLLKVLTAGGTYRHT